MHHNSIAVNPPRPVPFAGLAQQALEADALRIRQDSQLILFISPLTMWAEACMSTWRLEVCRAAISLAVLEADAGVGLLGEVAAESEPGPACSLKRGCVGAECRLCAGMAPGVLLGSGCGLHVSWLHSRVQLSSGAHDSVQRYEGSCYHRQLHAYVT